MYVLDSTCILAHVIVSLKNSMHVFSVICLLYLFETVLRVSIFYQLLSIMVLSVTSCCMCERGIR